MPFRFTLAPEFKKHLRDKPPPQQGVIMSCIDQLVNDPRHPGLRTRRIEGTKDIWEARADLDNRVSWQYGEPGELIIRYHCTHNEVYGRRYGQSS